VLRLCSRDEGRAKRLEILARRREQVENEAVQQTDLRTRRTPVHLAFANHMNRFVTGDGAPRTPERAEMLARVD
jgi:hypothetical protein